MLIYSARTANYDGVRVEGIDHYFEASGDFVSVVFRVMPHFADTERFGRIVDGMQSVTAVTLAEFRGGQPTPSVPVEFPAVGETDFDTFENNLLEVMQFVFNHTTFDPDYADDQAVLAAYRPLGVRPGQDPGTVDSVVIDGQRFRKAAEEQFNYWITSISETEAQMRSLIFQPKGKTSLEAVVGVSIAGPIGIPQEEAVYPQVARWLMANR